MQDNGFMNQKAFGVVMFVLISFTLVINIIDYYISPFGIDAYFFNISIIILIILLPIVAMTIFIDKLFFRGLLAFIIYFMAIVAILDSFESFWGWGLYLIFVGLFFLFGFLEKHAYGYMVLSFSVFIIFGVVGTWMKSKSVWDVLYSFSCVFFFSLMIWTITLVSSKTQLKIKELEETIINQDKVIERLTKSQDSIEKWNEEGKVKQNKSHLTQKEVQLVEVFCKNQGKFTNMELADILGMNESSVKATFHRIMQKVDVKSRTELLAKFGNYDRQKA